ncbi:MAG TPA: RluA family pseudouridine synthase [Solimonas sp.]|nr:RluA family pseudouridine synthase [Solimonas sp.]
MSAAPTARDGVDAGSVVLPPGNWSRVLDFVVERFPGVTLDQWRSRMERGLVTDEAGAALGPDAPYRQGLRVRYYRELPVETPIPFQAEVLFRDEHLLVADKPHFLPVTPSGRYLQQTLLVRLKNQLGIADLAPLHRIDRGTAGLVLFSIDPATRGRYQALFAQRQVAKLYEAIAPALPAQDFPRVHCSRLVAGEPFFRMREVDGAPNSETAIELHEPRGALALYRLRPLTGRKHQLRVHLAALGAPILNDPLYPELRQELEGDYSRPLQLLARTLAFDDPLSGQPRRFESRRRLQEA